MPESFSPLSSATMHLSGCYIAKKPWLHTLTDTYCWETKQGTSLSDCQAWIPWLNMYYCCFVLLPYCHLLPICHAHGPKLACCDIKKVLSIYLSIYAMQMQAYSRPHTLPSKHTEENSMLTSCKPWQLTFSLAKKLFSFSFRNQKEW